jgi:CheY-like chemotaxis protein
MSTKILIIEDEVRSRKLARDILESLGFETTVATNGEEGVALAFDSPPALVLLDIRLPGIDGREVLRQLRADGRTVDVPVVAVTASAMADERDTLLRQGFTDYLAKPYRYRELAAVAASILGDRS